MTYQQNQEVIIITEILHAPSIVLCIQSPSLDNKIWQLIQRQAKKDNSKQWSDGLWKVVFKFIYIFSFWAYSLSFSCISLVGVFLCLSLKNTKKLRSPPQKTLLISVLRNFARTASRWRASKYFLFVVERLSDKMNQLKLMPKILWMLSMFFWISWNFA